MHLPELHRITALALALLAPACTIQRASQMSRPQAEDRVSATHRVVTEETPRDQPIVGSAPVPGSDIVSTNATVLVRAPVARVREVLFDCARYPEFLTSYKSCSDLGANAAGGREMRMEMEELGGLIKIWFQVEINKAASDEGVEIYEGRLKDGNIAAFRSRWRLVGVDRGYTRLTIDSHLDPKLPLPAAIVNSGSIDGVREAILAIKRRAERGGVELGGKPNAL